jgi:hypothetical protein
VKIRELKIFEHLHNEKPSPLFLTLLKSNNNDDLKGIKNSNGNVFSSDQERHNFIHEFFQEIYTPKHTGQQVDYNTCISDFLGPEIANHPVVTGSKLTVQEKEELDSPLTISELDQSLRDCNPKSASGADGYTNKLIKLCWKYLRLPLLNYANCCFQKGILTPSFRSATIKLIPKKGDVSQLKNWRPISLLSNMYKIISRAFNSRLKKVTNRICSRAQKGYNSNRYVQEVLINVCETIAHCKAGGNRGAVVALDMLKAFDTLNHNFIKAVFKFFNLGNYLTNWLNILGNKRQASIILEDGHFSKTINLGTDRAQGDNLSPFIFNFCEQILIFKLELDNRILQIPRPIPAQLNLGVGVYIAESNRETGKNESLADDNTVLTLINPLFSGI